VLPISNRVGSASANAKYKTKFALPDFANRKSECADSRVLRERRPLRCYPDGFQNEMFQSKGNAPQEQVELCWKKGSIPRIDVCENSNAGGQRKTAPCNDREPVGRQTTE
jgi:hypothetical protein